MDPNVFDRFLFNRVFRDIAVFVLLPVKKISGLPCNEMTDLMVTAANTTMKLFFIGIIALATIAGCSKSKTDNGPTTCPEPMTWLTAKINSYIPCSCLMEVRKGTYNGQIVIWTGTVDPRCNGVDMIYKEDGTLLVTSGDAAAYKTVIDAVKDFTTIWTCAQGKQ